MMWFGTIGSLAMLAAIRRAFHCTGGVLGGEVADVEHRPQ